MLSSLCVIFPGIDKCLEILVALGVASGIVITILMTALITTVTWLICKHQGNHL